MTQPPQEIWSVSDDGGHAQTFMPAEHMPHQCTLTAFPNLAGVYDSKSALQASRQEVAAIANAISDFEPVWLYVTPNDARVAQSMVNDKVLIKSAEVDKLWTRDIGPVFLHDRTSQTKFAMDFNFNYWGGKCRQTVDHTFTRRILEQDFPNVSRQQARIVSEGGALEVDGDGTLLTTESAILNDNRNPGISREAIEMELKSLLGLKKIIWIKGLCGAETTDWHIDAFVRFVAPGHVLLSQPPPSASSRIQAIFNDANKTLMNATDAKDRKFEISYLPEPELADFPGGSVEGMVASYVNYALVNGGVVLAKFGLPESDEKALGLIKELYPDRKVSQVLINELPRLGGGIHCATQHVPASVNM